MYEIVKDSSKYFKLEKICQNNSNFKRLSKYLKLKKDSSKYLKL